MRNQQIDEESTIRIVSNKQMRFEVESFVREECNDDVMKWNSINQIKWSNHLIKKIFFEKKSSSIHSRFVISSIHLSISTYHYRFIYLSFNILSQSSIFMLRLIVSSDWSNEWCRSDEVVSEILRAFVETASWRNRLLTSLQSNIN
jgi:hypothetical protein